MASTQWPQGSSAWWHQQGRERQLQGDAVEAERAYRQALAQDPLYRRSLNNLAVLLIQRAELQEAEALLLRGVEQADPPEMALLLNTLCQLRLQQQRAAEAVAVARRLVRLAPQPLHLTNLAVALQCHGLPEQALRAQRQALGLAASADALPLLWQPLGDPVGSAQRQRQLQNLATMELTLDPFSQRGWRLLQARLAAQPQHWQQPPLPWQGLWDGTPVPELVLWDEQGFGDAIQCLRWVAAAARRTQQLTLWLRPALLPLAQRRLALPPHGRLRAWPEGLQPWCQGLPHLPLMSLPLALGLAGAALAAEVPLLGGPGPGAAPAGRPRRIGLVWAAGRKEDPEANRQARQRSLPLQALLEVLKPLRERGLVVLQPLQVGPDAHEADAFASLLEPAPPLADWEATAQQLERLDGLISVDTAVAHLAGSLGLPTWLLLPEPCDWRWGRRGQSSCWYRSVRLVRGADGGSVLRALQQALDQWI